MSQGFDAIDRQRSRVVAVTGAGGGIGRELVRQFAEDGYKVAAIGRAGDKLEAAAGQHDAISAFAADVVDADQCSAAMQAIADTLGPIEVLVAGAAIYPKGFFLDQPAQDFARTLRVNVEGVANTIRPVLPTMLERNYGRVVVIGSMADLAPLPGSLAYGVSKGALHPLVRGIAAEIDRDRYPDVLVNEFSPGATRTAMSEYGNDPKDIYRMLAPLVECGADGPHGRFFQEGREYRLAESWKGAIKRVLLRKG